MRASTLRPRSSGFAMAAPMGPSSLTHRAAKAKLDQHLARRSTSFPVAHTCKRSGCCRAFGATSGTPLDMMDLELLTRFDWVDANSPFDNSNPLFGGGSSSPDYIAPPNYTDSDNPPSRWRLTFGLNFFPTGQQTLKLGLNYQLNREIENVVTGMGTFRGVSNDILWVQATIAL